MAAPVIVGPSAHRCPTEWAYFSAREQPAVRRLRSVGRRVFGFDPFPPDDVARLVEEGLFLGDPVGEAFVAECFTPGRNGPALLKQALTAEGIAGIPDAPASLRALFAEFDAVPSWVDRALVEEGAAIWRRWGTDLFAFAGAETLEMYTETAVALPLSLTGGYAGDNALRRFLETARFWIDVSEPGALFTPGSAGRATAMHVRVMHVSVRRRAAEHPEWDESRFGVPISQTHMSLTLMGGSIVPALGLWAVGYQTTPREIRALLHFQRYLGHLLGVRPPWYPSNVRQAIQLVMLANAARTRTAGEHGRELIESFPRAFVPRPGLRGAAALRARRDHWLVQAYVAMFMAPWTRRSYDVPGLLPWLAVPLARFPWVAVQELARRVSPSVAARQDTRRRAHREAWLQALTNGRKARFEATDSLRR